MTTRTVAFTLVCFSGLAGGLIAFGADRHPKVLLILVDDLKPGLGCYCDATAKTRNIDELASRGMPIRSAIRFLVYLRAARHAAKWLESE